MTAADVHPVQSPSRPARVLWFTSRPLPAVTERLGRPARGSGYWISALMQAVRSRCGLQMSVATIRPGSGGLHFNDGGVEHFIIGQGRLAHKLGRLDALRRCRAIVDQWQPDLIHVHGTETVYGLLATQVSCPVVISLQGFLTAYRQHFWGSLSTWDILRAHSLGELLRGRGLYWQWRALARGERRERRILSGARLVMGRTDWDRAQARRFNPSVTYCHVGEILRPSFYAGRWDPARADRHSLIFTNAGSPCRGAETLLRAAALLRPRWPGITVRLGGELGGAYRGFLERLARRLGLSGRVEMPGYLSEQDLSRALLRSHVFVLPSHNENSPNSLAEAMLLGMPCVAGRAGGVPSMVEEGRTGLLFGPGEPAVLAERLGAVLGDESLALSLGQAARTEARARHDPDRVVAQLLEAHEQALGRPLRNQEGGAA